MEGNPATVACPPEERSDGAPVPGYFCLRRAREKSCSSSMVSMMSKELSEQGPFTAGARALRTLRARRDLNEASVIPLRCLSALCAAAVNGLFRIEPQYKLPTH
jgi:hypothetical protein